MQVPALTGEQALDPEREINWIVAYPHGSNIGRDATGQGLEAFPSKLTIISMHGAIMLQKQHPEAKIVIPGETLYDYAEGVPNTTDFMAEQALREAVAEDDLVRLSTLPDGRGLNNTYLQTQRVAGYFGGDHSGIITVTLDYHAERVQGAQQAQDVGMDLVTAEAILREAGVTDYERYASLIAKLRTTELLAKLMTADIGPLAQSRRPRIAKSPLRKGFLPNLLMEGLGPYSKGPRIVDVVEDERGLRLERDFAHAKQDRLLRELGLPVPARAAAA